MDDKEKMLLIAKLMRAGGGLPDEASALIDVVGETMEERQRRKEEEERMKALQSMQMMKA